jgi:hypothetical protein
VVEHRAGFEPGGCHHYTQELQASGIESVLGMRVGELGYGNDIRGLG